MSTVARRTLLHLACCLPAMPQTSPYRTERRTVDGLEVITLRDSAHKTELSVLPGVGNIAYDLRVKSQPLLWFPAASVGEFRAKPTLAGVPFLGPWANRLAGDAYHANGKRYVLNPGLNNLRRDGNGNPIHGLLAYVPDWKVTAVDAGDNGARVTSRLEFWRRPDWLAQFPFPHTLEMTYRLRNGVVEVETTVENHGADPLPLAIGFHPYFQLPRTPRDEWRVRIPARDHVVLSRELIPTGERQPVASQEPVALAGKLYDDVYNNLVRGADGRSVFSVEGRGESVRVAFGPKYTVGVVYAPARPFVCFEPMTALTNGFNLAHEGKYKELQSVAPGATWRESFWIEPTVTAA